MAMMAVTTSNSTSVKPLPSRGRFLSAGFDDGARMRLWVSLIHLLF
jgi:hypothetical protein